MKKDIVHAPVRPLSARSIGWAASGFYDVGGAAMAVLGTLGGAHGSDRNVA
jgi:hypothetical protein